MIDAQVKFEKDWQQFKSDAELKICLLYTSDAADERSSVDLGGRRIIKKKNIEENVGDRVLSTNTWSRL